MNRQAVQDANMLFHFSRRFAAAPTTTPVIPAWQMKTSASQPTLNGDADASVRFTTLACLIIKILEYKVAVPIRLVSV